MPLPNDAFPLIVLVLVFHVFPPALNVARAEVSGNMAL